MNFQRQRNRAIADRDAINLKYKTALREIEKLRAENKALRAEVEALRPDAEKFRAVLNTVIPAQESEWGDLWIPANAVLRGEVEE